MTETDGAAPLSCRLSNKEPTCAAPLVGPAVTLEFELTALPAPLNCFLGAQFWGVIHNLSPKSDLESQVGGWDWELGLGLGLLLVYTCNLYLSLRFIFLVVGILD